MSRIEEIRARLEAARLSPTFLDGVDAVDDIYDHACDDIRDLLAFVDSVKASYAANPEDEHGCPAVIEALAKLEERRG